MSWQVVVEVLVLRHLEDGLLGFRRAAAQASENTDLDRLGHELAGARDGPAGAVLHSTSWRVEHAHLLAAQVAPVGVRSGG